MQLATELPRKQTSKQTGRQTKQNKTKPKRNQNETKTKQKQRHQCPMLEILHILSPIWVVTNLGELRGEGAGQLLRKKTATKTCWQRWDI